MVRVRGPGGGHSDTKIIFCLIKYFSQVGREKGTDVVRVRVNPKFYRPTEVEQLLGDPRKANEKLKWKPKVDFLIH